MKSTLDEYTSLYEADMSARRGAYMTIVNDYYDLVTDFYEFGWGQSFHFAPRFSGEAFPASLARHEMSLAHRLGLKPGMKVLDVGCGVGGPMRTIARFSGATVVGVNNNDYQIARGTRHTEAARLSHLCSFLKADFLAIPVPDGSFDAAYAIEATCHAPDKTRIFTELFRVLRPGAEVGVYEWCLTSRYDPANPEHRAIKAEIEIGNALPDIWTMPEVLRSVEESGFEVVESRDRASESDPETPWWLPLAGRISLSGFKHTRAGRALTNVMVRGLETVRVAPKGSTAVSTFLNASAAALVKGGETGIFTPMFFVHAKKPG